MKKIYEEAQGIKIASPADCGNAPKKMILKDLLKAFAVTDIPFIREHVAEDVHWEIINHMSAHGREKMAEVLESKMTIPAVELDIDHIITHGKTASANGTAKFADNSSCAFCHVYEFVSAGKNKIKKITSYVMKMDEHT